MSSPFGLDPFLRATYFGAIVHNREEQAREAMRDEAHTAEADAWNRLASIRGAGEFVTIPASPLTNNWAISRQPSFPDDELLVFRFRRTGRAGGLCEQWELLS